MLPAVCLMNTRSVRVGDWVGFPLVQVIKTRKKIQSRRRPSFIYLFVVLTTRCAFRVIAANIQNLFLPNVAEGGGGRRMQKSRPCSPACLCDKLTQYPIFRFFKFLSFNAPQKKPSHIQSVHVALAGCPVRSRGCGDCRGADLRAWRLLPE